jgi:formylglycine-generating enzyme required for sulfatase activity
LRSQAPRVTIRHRVSIFPAAVGAGQYLKGNANESLLRFASFFCAHCFFALRPINADVTIDTVYVGNAGNPNDPSDGDTDTAGIQNFGAVASAYRIGTYEVTVGQYTEFLNAVAMTDTYALFNPLMATDLKVARISRSGLSGSFTYTVIGSPNHPVTYVSWGDAARFSNWLHNNQPTGLQVADTTEDGAYHLDGAITREALNNVSRKPGAQWFIPTENQWYKAAYHQPAGQGGDVDDYWLYPTRSNSEPNSDQPPGDPSIENNVANFFRDDGVANGYNDGLAVTGSTIFSSDKDYLTDAGAYTSAPGPYGTFDQGGNAYEWNETLFSGVFRSFRGGSWDFGSLDLQSSYRSGASSALERFYIGFRVATIPEPNTMTLVAIAGMLGLAMVARRKRNCVASH